MSALTANGRRSAGTLVGEASTFNREYLIPTVAGPFREVIKPNAFQEVLSDPSKVGNVVLNRDHDNARLLGRVRSGTLELSESITGLRMRAALPDTPTGVETVELIERGDITAASFRFGLARDTWYDDGGKYPLRAIESFGVLGDVSIVVSPANDSTWVALEGVGLRSGARRTARERDSRAIWEARHTRPRINYGRRIDCPSQFRSISAARRTIEWPGVPSSASTGMTGTMHRRRIY